MRHLKQNPTRRASAVPSGFTIVELVIAFIIIAVLTLIITPTLSNRAQEARIAAARQDVEHLAEAMERAAIDTGYLYRMYVLNDVPGGDGVSNVDEDDIIQGIRDNDVTSDNPYESPSEIFISPYTQDFAPDQDDLFNRLTQGNNAETDFGWHGPYVNWRRDTNDNDWPDDPWGNDYLFFSSAGILYPPVPGATGELSQDHSDTFQDTGPDFTTDQGANQSYNALIFDRFAILSMGPNGLPGDGSGSGGSADRYGGGDDIIRFFGGTASPGAR